MEPQDAADGRSHLLTAPASPALPWVEKKLPTKYQALKFVVNLLFLPVEALKEILERRPAMLRRPE
jgi:hypothetical protein